MLISRTVMKAWVVEALNELGGEGSILEICKIVWERHGKEIQESGDSFYTWQYEIRWAGDILRKESTLLPSGKTKRKKWILAKK